MDDGSAELGAQACQGAFGMTCPEKLEELGSPDLAEMRTYLRTELLSPAGN